MQLKKKKKREKEEKKRNSLTPQLASYVIEIAFEANPFFLQKKKTVSENETLGNVVPESFTYSGSIRHDPPRTLARFT